MIVVGLADFWSAFFRDLQLISRLIWFPKLLDQTLLNQSHLHTDEIPQSSSCFSGRSKYLLTNDFLTRSRWDCFLTSFHISVTFQLFGGMTRKADNVEASTQDGTSNAHDDHAHQAHDHHFAKPWSMVPWLSFATLGVVYGDIGTSPLYTLQSLFTPADVTSACPYTDQPNYEQYIPKESDVIGGVRFRENLSKKRQQITKKKKHESRQTNSSLLPSSLILWSLLLTVTFKYVIVLLGTTNLGEGGTFALLALIRRGKKTPKWVLAFTPFLTLLSAAFLFGDGALTPAISVTSAVQGLEVPA